MKQLARTLNNYLLFFILLVIVLVYGRPILIPLSYGIMLAMLMAPLIRKLEKKGFKRIFSSILCLFLLLVIIGGISGIIIWQFSNLQKDLPAIEQKLNSFLLELHGLIEKEYGFSVQEQQQVLQKQLQKVSEASTSYIGNIIGGASNFFIQLFVTFIVTFLLLFQKEKYHTFFLKVLQNKRETNQEELLNSITKVSQQYLVGRLISIFILFVLYLLALFIIGIKNALLLAGIAALVNIIPYLGPILAGVFPALVALVTEETYMPVIWVIISFIIIQAIDNYFVTPYFMGREVNLSALATILIIICGGFIWGVSGMILFVPFLSIAKIIFDRIDALKPYGYLIGDTADHKTSLPRKPSSPTS